MLIATYWRQHGIFMTIIFTLEIRLFTSGYVGWTGKLQGCTGWWKFNWNLCRQLLKFYILCCNGHCLIETLAKWFRCWQFLTEWCNCSTLFFFFKFLVKAIWISLANFLISGSIFIFPVPISPQVGLKPDTWGPIWITLHF